MEPFNYGSSYEEFMVRMRKRLRDQNVSEDILALLKSGFEKALNEQNVVLSRQERVRSFHTLSKEILAELTNQLDVS
jgi:hypothetical protein